MGELKFLISHTIAELWRRRWSVLILAWMIGAMGAAFAVTRPDSFEARAQVFVDIRALLRDLLNDDAYIGDPIEDVENVRRLMYARPNIRDIVYRTDLHLEAETQAQEETVVDRVQEQISFLRKNRNHFFITYQHHDPEKAQAVVQAMLDLFLEESYARAGHSGETDEALTLAERDFREVAAQLETVQADIAVFERDNPEALTTPGSVLGRKQRIDASLAQLRSERTFQEGELRRLRAELSSTPREIVVRVIPGQVVRETAPPPPMPPTERRAPVPRLVVTPEEQRYEAALADARRQQAEVDSLLRSFTPEYPGVRDAQQRAAQAQAAAQSLGVVANAARQRILDQIAAAEAQNRRVDQLQADYQRRLFDHQNRPVRENRTPDQEIYGPNARYAEVQSQIGSLQSRLAVTRQEIRAAEQRLIEVQALLDQQPIKLQQYEGLTDLRDDLQARYRTIEARIDQLQATVRASDTELVRFEVIEAPSVNAKPVAPNRLLLLAGVFIVAGGLGVGQAFARSQISDTLPTTTHLRRAFDLPVLGAISRIESRRKAAFRMIGNIIWLIGAAAFATLFAGLIYLYHIKGARPDLGALAERVVAVAKGSVDVLF